MLADERFNGILDIVKEKGTVTVGELSRSLRASKSTIRRDLTTLDKQGLLVKVHGGATNLNVHYVTKDADMETKHDMNKEDKLKIAKYAASLIQPDDFVYIDAGTTTEIMIDYITQKNALFVTNATVHARKLAQRGFQVYILGGELKPTTDAIVGSEAILCLQKYNFSIGFWGANGVNQQTGYSTPDVHESLVKAEAMKHCKDRYVLCDATKFGQISSATFGDFSSATIITTRLQDRNLKKCNNIKEV